MLFLLNTQGWSQNHRGILRCLQKCSKNKITITIHGLKIEEELAISIQQYDCREDEISESILLNVSVGCPTIFWHDVEEQLLTMLAVISPDDTSKRECIYNCFYMYDTYMGEKSDDILFFITERPWYRRRKCWHYTKNSWNWRDFRTSVIEHETWRE